MRTNQQELHKSTSARKRKQENWTAIHLINSGNSAIQSAIMTVVTKARPWVRSAYFKRWVSGYKPPFNNDASNVTVLDSAKTSYKAKVVRTNAKSDLALLKVENATFNASKISLENNARIGTSIICAGSPLTANLNQTVSEGIINGHITQKGFQHYAFSATVHPGNSGGGLFNTQGELIGIVSARTNEGQQIDLQYLYHNSSVNLNYLLNKSMRILYFAFFILYFLGLSCGRMNNTSVFYAPERGVVSLDHEVQAKNGEEELIRFTGIQQIEVQQER